MIGENPQVVADEPVEFENEPVEVEYFRRITDHFRGIYRKKALSSFLILKKTSTYPTPLNVNTYICVVCG